MLRRFVATIVAVASAMIAFAAPVAAAPVEHLQGDLTVVNHNELGDGCSFVHAVSDGAIVTARGPDFTVHTDGCFAFDEGATGGFSLSRPGGTLTGTYSPGAGPVATAPLVFVITDGTRRYRDASGSLTLVVSTTQDIGPLTQLIAGTIDGTIIRH